MMDKKKWKLKIHDFFDQTKRILYNMKDPDDYAPTAMLAKGEEIIIGVIPTDKYTFYEMIGNLAFQHQTECIATAMVCWMIPPDGIRPEDMSEDKEWIGPQPSKHPNRKEAIQIWAAYGKEQFGHIAEFTRRPNGRVLKYTDIDFDMDDEKVTIKNYLWETVVNAMRDKEFKP
jgi:hypothetical protein